MTDDLVGQDLDEYRLEALLGSGGMARVYRALDVRLRRYVAIKVIDTPYQTDADYLERFHREAQAIAKLEHPHIVRLYRYGEAEGVLYMAMQYVKGADLRFVLNSYADDGQLIEPEEASRITRQLCSALDYAHSQGVIHRDVKPANVLLNDQGDVLLSDFGLALLTEIGTRGEVFGSPHYIPPEQAISSAGSVPQSDQYSVGVMLYQMFTSQVPFDAPEPLDIAMMHMSEPPPAPRSIRPDLEPGVEAVIMKALAKAPEDRYPTASALAEALENALGRTKPHVPAMGQLTIPQRVQLEIDANPLPPLPAEISGPPVPDPTVERAAFPAAPAPAPEPAPEGRARPRSGKASAVPWVTCGLLAVAAICAGLGLLWAGSRLLRDRSGEAAVAAETQNAAFYMTATADEPQGSRSATATALAEADPFSATLSVLPGVSPSKFAPTPTLYVPRTPTPGTTETTEEPEAPPENYQLLIATKKEDSLFVVNLSSGAFPLSELYLENKDGEISGSEWDVASLPSGACVAIWDDDGRPDAPDDIDCDLVGDRVTRSGKRRFWKRPFDVFYDDTLITGCRNRCEVEIPR